MKASVLALAATTAVGLAAAQGHNHNHRHLHKRATRTETSWVSGPTAYVFTVVGGDDDNDDGTALTLDQACSGLKNEELKLPVNGIMPEGLCSSSASVSTTAVSSATSSAVVTSTIKVTTTSALPTTAATSSTLASTTTAAAVTTTAALSTGGAQFYPKQSSTQAASSSSSSVSTSSPSPSAGSSSGSGLSGATGVTADFPDGELDCGTFPSQYGAVSLSYLGMGGWSGLQAVTFGANAITHIVTGVSGDKCQEGMMCSYACPPGYQKSQWPSAQGSTGQSVGGIQCKNGKLHLTNAGLSTKLCVPGMGNVQASNKAGGVVSICRTDYPGTESETIPVELQPGQTDQVTNPNAATYYSWQGKATSAQYYLNPIGTSASKGCQWGSPGGNIGNYAPINFGVGYKDGKTWLSIFQNAPTTSTLYEGTVELQGDLSDVCKYSNGQYCGATGCNSNGCTVAVNSGVATFVISN